MRKCKLTQEEKSSLVKDFKNGMSVLVLCEKYGVSECTIRRTIPLEIRQDIDHRRDKLLSDDKIKMLLEDRALGLTYKELGDKYGVSVTTVWYYLPDAQKTMQSEKDVRLESAMLEYVGGHRFCRSVCKKNHTDHVKLLKMSHEKFPEKFRCFDGEFRRKVVLDATGSSPSEVAKHYGISVSAVRKWMRKSEEGTLNNMGQRYLKKNLQIPNKNEGVAEKEYPNIVSLG